MRTMLTHQAKKKKHRACIQINIFIYILISPASPSLVVTVRRSAYLRSLDILLSIFFVSLKNANKKEKEIEK